MNLFSNKRQKSSSRPHRDNRFGSNNSLLGMILLFPVRVVLLPFTSILKRWRDRELDRDRPSRTLRHKLLSFGKQIGRLPSDLFLLPAKIFGNLRRRKRSELVLAGSVLLTCLTVVLAYFYFYVRPDYLATRYHRDAQNAVAAGDFEVASANYQRLAAANKLSDADKFQQVMALQKIKKFEQADAILDDLAPDDGTVGFSLAHQIKAIRIAKNLGQSTDALILKKLRCHLELSGDNSPELDRAWAIFYLNLEQPDQALSALKRSASSNPENYLLMAQIYAGQKRELERAAALNEAKTAYISAVEKNPMDQQSRILAASITAQLKQYDLAEQLLKEGLQLRSEPLMRRTLASFYIMRNDFEQSSLNSRKRSLDWLIKALDVDPDYPPIYQRLLEMSAGDEQTTTFVRQTIEQRLKEKPSAMAHLTLSNLLKRDGEDMLAQNHLEQAYKLDNNNLIILNNLAWSLANGESPNLERALALSVLTVESEPNNTGFHDTYGTILLKLGRYKEAATELQRALVPSSDNHQVHQKLAAVYQQLNMSDLADAHSKKGFPADRVAK